MTSEAVRFGVEVDELLQVVDDLAASTSRLDDLLDEVARQVRRLHSTWEGAAARAQLVAQQEWESGFRDMRAALEDLRAAGEVAHGNYTDAVATNVAMWERVR